MLHALGCLPCRFWAGFLPCHHTIWIDFFAWLLDPWRAGILLRGHRIAGESLLCYFFGIRVTQILFGPVIRDHKSDHGIHLPSDHRTIRYHKSIPPAPQPARGQLAFLSLTFIPWGTGKLLRIKSNESPATSRI